jgi:uncharacterized membrane protein
LVLAGLSELLELETEQFPWVLIPLNVVIVAAFADPVGRFLAAAFAAAAFAVAALGFLIFERNLLLLYQSMSVAVTAGAVVVWESRGFGRALWREVRAPLGIALAGGALAMFSWDVAERWGREPSVSFAPTLGLAVLGAVLAVRIHVAHGVRRPTVGLGASLAAIALVGAASWNTPGILAAMVVLAVGYHRREIVLIGLAGAFLVGFTGWYYYALHLTLLQKSGALVLSGGVLLAVRQWLRHGAQAAPAQGATA